MKLATNTFLRALFYLFIVSSVVHLIIIGIYTVSTGDASRTNFFDIIGATLLFPSLRTISLPLSLLCALALFSVMYYIAKHEEKHEGRRTR